MQRAKINNFYKNKLVINSITSFFIVLFLISFFSTYNFKIKSSSYINIENIDFEEEELSSDFILFDTPSGFENIFTQTIIFENLFYKFRFKIFIQSIAIYIKVCNFRI